MMKDMSLEKQIEEQKKKMPDQHSHGITTAGYILRLIACVAILGVGYTVANHFWQMKRKPRQKSASELIKRLVAMPVTTGDVRLSISGYGNAEPLAEITLSSEVAGRILYINPKAATGLLVKKGDVLCEIDKQDYETTLRLNQAATQRLEAEVAVKTRLIADAEKELQAILEIYNLEVKSFERTKKLFEKKVASQSAYEDALQQKVDKLKQKIVAESLLETKKLELETLKADAMKAKANVAQARYDLSRCKIISPFLARINESYIDELEYVNKGQHLFDIADESNLEIAVSLDAVEAAKVLGLMDAKARIPNYTHWLTAHGRVDVVIEWTQNPKKCCYQGKLLKLEKFDTKTRTITFIVQPTKADHADLPLVSGMFCKVTLLGKQLQNAAKIPKVAIQFDNDVYVINKQGRLEQRYVTVAGSVGDQVVISEGVKHGEMVVVQRMPRGIVDGMKVEPILYQPKLTAETNEKVQN